MIDFISKRVHASLALETDSLAVCETLIFCSKTGLFSVGIKSDCANVLERCGFNGSDPPWDIVNIFEDIKSLVRHINVVFCNVRLSANKVTDFIAKYVVRNSWSSGGLSTTTIMAK